MIIINENNEVPYDGATFNCSYYRFILFLSITTFIFAVTLLTLVSRQALL